MEELSRYESYKDSGVEWLGEIPSHWCVGKTKHGIKYVLGKFLHTEQLNKEGRGIRSIRASQCFEIAMSRDEVYYDGDTEHLVTVNEDDYIVNFKGYRPENKDDLMGKSAYGVSGVLTNNLTKVVAINGMNQNYANFYSSSCFFERYVKSRGNGTIVFNAEGCRHNIPLCIPPVEEQEKIGEYLYKKVGAIDSVIAKKQKLIENLKLSKQALITETVTKGLDDTVPMKDSEIGKIPSHWKLSKVKYIVELEPKKSEIGKLSKELEVSFTPMEKLRQGKLDGSNVKYLGEVYSKYTYIKNGDIAMARVTPCFENYNIAIANDLVNGIAFGSSEILVLRSLGVLDVRLVYYYMQHEGVRNLLISTMHGAAGLKRINTKVLLDTYIPIQNEKEQKEIVEYLDKKVGEFDRLISLQEKSIENLKLNKQKLITEVVTGKLKVC